MEVLKSTFLSELIKKDFGRGIIDRIQQKRHLSVKGSVGSSVSIFVSEIFLTQQKNIFFILDKES